MTSITSSATNAPPGSVAGVALPDSLAREITERVRNTASPLLFDQSRRVLQWSALTGVRRGLKFDAELFYTGTMLLDMGLTPQYSSAGERFEAEGANAARYSTVSRKRGAAHGERDIRGTAPIFFTGQGNWDMDTKPGMSPQVVADA
jgi:Catalase